MRKGFTLLEVMVATLIMGIAVVGLLSNLSTSMRNASKITEHDRAAMIARAKMDDLLLDHRLPRNTALEGPLAPDLFSGQPGGWRAMVTIVEPPAYGGSYVLDRVGLEIWWGEGGSRRTFAMEGYRPSFALAGELAP